MLCVVFSIYYYKGMTIMPRKIVQNRIATPELIAQIDPTNIALMEGFLTYLRTIQKSDGTIREYRYNVRIALIWNLKYNDNKLFTDWEEEDIMRFQEWTIEHNKNSPNRVHTLKSTLSSMSNYIRRIHKRKYPGFENIVNNVEHPPLELTQEKTIFTEEDVDLLLDMLTSQEKFDRACCVSLAVNSGRRKSELLRFKVSDFTDDHLTCNGGLYKSTPIRTKGRGKHGKKLVCYTVAKRFKPYFDNWMNYRELHGITGDFLFPSPNDNTIAIKPTTLTEWANVFSLMLNCHFYWHALRHFACTQFKRAGVPDSVIKAYFGWSTSAMVDTYNDLTVDEQLDMYFNGDGIKTLTPKSFNQM